MDKKHSRHKHSKRGLPNTPRVSDKIMEYYEKFGQDRDLEKFMRLYSPASSQDSQKAQRVCGTSMEVDTCCLSTQSHESVSSMGSCEALAKMPSRPLSVCCAVNSKSLPNIDKQGQELLEENFPAKDIIIDVNIEMESDVKKLLSTSTENIKTPKKTLRDNKTQTPESVAKIHRRLEWDSLGDVGYKKSMSTSNISILERSLLKEFFKECTITSEPGTSRQATEKTAEQEKHQKQIIHKMVKCIKNTEIEHGTPPLACSTLVEDHKEKSLTKSVKPKMITQSTSSTSLQEKFEKYAQTSLLKPPSVHSQEIQCTMSSSNSIIEGTATPSSFEYYSSRSSKSRSSKSPDLMTETNTHTKVNPSEHPFITSITDLLMKRKVLCEKNQQKQIQLDNIRELQKRFQTALEENKENQSQHSTTASSTINSFSLTKQAPELDLGIQLICSLIDAKSVNGRQKKQLIRDIVKRITRLDAGALSNDSSISRSGTTTTNSNESSNIKPKHLYDSIHSNSNGAMQGALNDLLVTSEAGIAPISSPVYSHVSKEIPRQSNGSAIVKPLKKYIELSSLKEEPPPGKCNENNLTCPMKQLGNVLKENNRKVTNLTKAKTNKETESATVETLRNTPTEIKYSTKSLEKQKNRSTQTSNTSTSSDGTRSRASTKSSSATTSSTTQDVITQKILVAPKDLNNSTTDAEQPTMREWLNPLTQSEIEYEERKAKEIKKKAALQQVELRERGKHLKKSSKHDCGRVQQLNWIENEIHRLECLKHLLLKDETNTTTNSERTTSTDWASRKENLTKESTQTDKLYDTVYSDKSSVLSESAEVLVKEIEIILEESNEDVINLNDNLKRTKERKRETQIIYEKPNSKNNHKFRTMKETTTINEEQLIKNKDSEGKILPKRQREKIDTPSSTENSNKSESLKDMVKQKKHDFMEAYKTKKQNHYAALKQQQKDEFELIKIQKQTNDKSSHPTTTTVSDDHYSVPHTMTRKYSDAQNPLPLTPKDKQTTTTPPSSAQVISSPAISLQQTNSENKLSNKPEKNISYTKSTTTTKTTSTTSSSTSIFCISSDVSVPMGGSQLTSSTPTTTHHYDDVSAAVFGVAIQTSDSIIRTKPIYGPPMMPCLHTKRLAPCFRKYATTSTSTACIQVKPKSIAYVIEFDNDRNSNLHLKNNSDNINSVTENSESSNSHLTNNIKALLPSEPQLTLQDYLQKAKPDFLQHSKERQAILTKLQSMRQARDLKLREIVDNSSFNSLERRLRYLPPPPIQKVRILNTKEMKALTNKRFVNLPEVVARKERAKEEQYRRSNRILRDIFNRRLQKNVLKGKLSLNHSKTVI